MALTKATNRMIDGAKINVRDFGAVGDGVTDDTVAIRAAIVAAELQNDPSGVVSGTLVLNPGDRYLISDTLQVYNISIEGNGCVIDCATATTVLNIYGTRMYVKDFHIIFSGVSTNPLSIGVNMAELGQFSKNIIENIHVRNAYIGWNTENTYSTMWGNTFTNCRADFCNDWGFNFDCKVGTTTNTFINCHANAGRLSATAKGFYFYSIVDLVTINIAVDGMLDGECVVVSTCQVWTADVIAIESCDIITHDKKFVTCGATHATIGKLKLQSCEVDVGAGNRAHGVYFFITDTAAIDYVIHNTMTVTSGTLYDVYSPGTTGARLKMNDVPYDTTAVAGKAKLFTNGHDDKVISRGNSIGYSNAAPVIAGLYRDVFLNQNPGPGEYSGWICTTAGAAGVAVWKGYGLIEA